MNDKNSKENTLLCDKAVEFILTRDIEELGALTEEKVAETLEVKSSDLTEIFETHQPLALNHFISREKIYRAVFMLEKNPLTSIEGLSTQLGFCQIDDFVMEFQNHIFIDPYRYKELKLRQHV
jgi:transcriptional regulator GlxA family with amidase domain